MLKRVPYLHEEHIERDAAALLAEYERASGVRIVRVVPIEDLVEKYLKLRLEFDDLNTSHVAPRSGLGLEPDILGAIIFDEPRIIIDESLDPEEHPSKEGRYRFTLAHEGGGHWRLHRHLFVNDLPRFSLFSEPRRPSIVCRSNQRRESIEWQADFYASCLLMPRKLVMAAWGEMFPDRRPRVIRPQTPVDHSFVEVPRIGFRWKDRQIWATDDHLLDSVAHPLAEQFMVSPVAMRIRLEKLGLLHRVIPNQRAFSGA